MVIISNRLQIWCIIPKKQKNKTEIRKKRYLCDNKTMTMATCKASDIKRTAQASVALSARDGKIWLSQQEMAELFATYKQAVSHHFINILKE